VSGGGVTEAASSEQAPKGTNERHFTIAGDGTVHVRAPSGQPQWKFTATPIAHRRCARQGSGTAGPRSLQMSYKIEDDYGVTEAQAHFAARAPDAPQGPQQGSQQEAQAARPLFEPPQFPLVLPMRGPATGSARP